MIVDTSATCSVGNSHSRSDRLIAEINHAIRNTAQPQLCACLARVVPAFGTNLSRRVRNLGSAVTSVTKLAAGHASAMSHALEQGAGREYVGECRANCTDYIKNKTANASRLLADVVQNPRETAPHIVVGALSFYLGSGGLDGDGGIPDQDLDFGLGAHRSIFFHSIFAGAAVETIAILALDLIRTVHANLPADHDQLWNDLVTGSTGFANTFTRGVSAGIAYHLCVDATIDGGATYKDIPFSMPIQGHQTLAGINAAAEGIDAAGNSHRINEHVTPNPSTTYRSRAQAKAAAKNHPGWTVKFLGEQDGYRLVCRI